MSFNQGSVPSINLPESLQKSRESEVLLAKESKITKFSGIKSRTQRINKIVDSVVLRSYPLINLEPNVTISFTET